MKRIILIGLSTLVILLCGCTALSPVAFDEVTLREVEQTILFEKADFEMANQALIDCGAPEQVILELKVRHDSEMLRLESWKVAEEAKKLVEE